MDVEVEDIAAELWVKQLGTVWLGELAEARRSSPRMMAGEMGSSGGASGESEASRRCVALKWTCWD